MYVLMTTTLSTWMVNRWQVLHWMSLVTSVFQALQEWLLFKLPIPLALEDSKQLLLITASSLTAHGNARLLLQMVGRMLTLMIAYGQHQQRLDHLELLVGAFLWMPDGCGLKAVTMPAITIYCRKIFRMYYGIIKS